ncbi:MAG: acetyl-CoA carboxylase biotin carboxylase subunit [Gemmatimonadales bacterium]|nr:acetyl-CoA carboxylase biotin carboxylase subunit [Gemmatimonadales bacterium]
MRQISRILIANRGEIARRIIRACHEEDLEAVAVYSEADRSALHVRAADFAVPIGAAPPGESYLRIDRLIAAAHHAGAQAIHPGYGFLAERAEFAEAVLDAGLGFVGPGPEAMRAMGDKTEARRRMEAAGVPVVPGTTEDLTSLDQALSVAESLGYPVMVKAAAGGGGKGMRVVGTPRELSGALELAQSEARKAFGDDAVYLEKFIERPRHVEFQILADGSRTVHLGERECSIQRRHQKLVEEAPSVAVSAELRDRMGRAAVAAAHAVGYLGAGTCEFLLADNGSFYFLEMNTRIQVEHPVTEMILGVDLVREQLRIARGLPMTPGDGPHSPNGWAIECRITSEDPAHGFLPSTGRVRYLRAPGGPGVRWDGGVETGDEVTLFYDSLLGKLIVWAPDRPQAIGRMLRALNELLVIGVATNQGFHRRLLDDPAFRSGEFDIQFLDRRPDLLSPPHDPELATAIAVAAALAEDDARRARRPTVADAAAAASSAWIRVGRKDALR